ncbi:MAG: NAD-dependent epimerase/dehydratase family protein [Pseudomonadota bacterium]
MTNVVLGATGHLGRMLHLCWRDEDFLWQSRHDRRGFVTCDLLNDPDGLIALLRVAGNIICLAGVTRGPAMEDNVTLAGATLDAAARAGAGRVFLVSSAAVYGDQAGPLSEDAARQPLSDYAHAKCRMEDLARRHPHPSIILRIGNVAGADTILGRWRDGMALDADANGVTPRRSYIGPRMLARALRALMAMEDLPDILNIAAPGSVEMGALLDAAKLPWTPRPASPHTIWEVTLATGRLDQLVGSRDGSPASIVADWQSLMAHA